MCGTAASHGVQLATADGSAAGEGNAMAESADASSPFLRALLDPPRTVPLVDAARTYDRMDVIGDCHVYDPALPNVRPSPARHAASQPSSPSSSPSDSAPGTLRSAHARGELWRARTGTAHPPRWFEELCRDLFFRRQASGDAAAASPSASPLRAVSDDGSGDGSSSPPVKNDGAGLTEVDPYAWLPFELLSEENYRVEPYQFPPASQYSPEQQQKLCLGDCTKEYAHFCNTYCFPQRYQIPTSIGTEPARLWVDPNSAREVIFLQLSPNFPPAMWLPIRGTADAVRRVLAEFAQLAVLHRDRHHATFVAREEEARRVMRLQRLPCDSDGDVLRFQAYDARNAPYQDAPMREYRNEQEFFLGEFHDPEELMERLDLCPFLFAIPHMRTVVDPHAEHSIPTVTGPGVAPSLYRCVHSKALLLVNVHLSAEVKLPPQDPEVFQMLWKDAQALPKMKIPVFARVVWPDNTKMSAGGLLARRFNALFGTEFAQDVPPDAIMALFYIMHWADRTQDLLGVRGMRQRVAELELALLRAPPPPLLYPGTREVPNPEYTVAERLGMHLQYLCELGDPDGVETVRRVLARPGVPAAVRMGCAKAALIAGDRGLFRQIVSSEPPGRMQLYMTKLVRKRKARDLTDPVPRLLDDQYEYAAPLWTKKGARVDRNSVEGAISAASSRLTR